MSGCALNRSSTEDPTCPIRGDYRLFTDWRPRCAVQYPQGFATKGDAKPPTAHQYRAFLMNNAQAIMDANAQAAKTKARCGPPCDVSSAPPSWQEGTALKEFEAQACDTRTCSFARSTPMGLGRGGRGGPGEATAFDPPAFDCCGVPFDPLRTGPDASTGNTLGRWAVPSGGSPL